jgi:hypothetical protein
VPGIGCGTLIAPVLARLDGINGVLESRVEATGRHFVIRSEPMTDIDDLAKRVIEVLGPGSVRLDPPWDATAVTGYGLGELWMTAATTRALSFIEARILSVHRAARAAHVANLDAATTLELQESLYRELVVEFERVHDQGGSTDRAWWVRPFADAFERAVAALPAITATKRGVVRLSLLAA